MWSAKGAEGPTRGVMKLYPLAPNCASALRKVNLPYLSA